jgi:hypothetical protein
MGGAVHSSQWSGSDFTNNRDLTYFRIAGPTSPVLNAIAPPRARAGTNCRRRVAKEGCLCCKRVNAAHWYQVTGQRDVSGSSTASRTDCLGLEPRYPFLLPPFLPPANHTICHGASSSTCSRRAIAQVISVRAYVRPLVVVVANRVAKFRQHRALMQASHSSARMPISINKEQAYLRLRSWKGKVVTRQNAILVNVVLILRG